MHDVNNYLFGMLYTFYDDFDLKFTLYKMSKKTAKADRLRCMMCTKDITDRDIFILARCYHRCHWWHVECEQSLSCCSSYTAIIIRENIDGDSAIYMPNAFLALTVFSRETFDASIIVSENSTLIQKIYMRALAWIKSCVEWGVTDSTGSHYNTDKLFCCRTHLPYDYTLTPACKEHLRSLDRSIFHNMIVSAYPMYTFSTIDDVHVSGGHPTLVRDLIFRHMDNNDISHCNYTTMQIKAITKI